MSYPHTYSAGRVTDDVRSAHLGLQTDFNDALARTVSQIGTGASQIHAGAAGIGSAAPNAATSQRGGCRAMPPSSRIAAPCA